MLVSEIVKKYFLVSLNQNFRNTRSQYQVSAINKIFKSIVNLNLSMLINNHKQYIKIYVEKNK